MMRRVVLTEMAEVWSRRNSRSRLIAIDRRAVAEYEAKVPWGQRPLVPDIHWAAAKANISRREPLLAADREHLASLRRVLASLNRVLAALKEG